MSITDYQVHLTLKSQNEKTGPIPVSTTERKCCPSTCPLKANGCYANGGPLAMHWRKVDDHKVGTGWAEFCGKIEALPKDTLWRHNQAGDLPSHDGQTIDMQAMVKLTIANLGKRGFTFTHHDPLWKMNAAVIRVANANGFMVNLSANNLDNADYLASMNIGPVVTIVPEGFSRLGETPAGRKVAVCPAQLKDGITCASCQLCARPNRKIIIAFRVHGSQKKRAAQALGL